MLDGLGVLVAITVGVLALAVTSAVTLSLIALALLVDDPSDVYPQEEAA